MPRQYTRPLCMIGQRAAIGLTLKLSTNQNGDM